MRVGIDIGPIAGARTGVGNYCLSLLTHLLALGNDDRYWGFSSGRARVIGGLRGLAGYRHIPVPTRALYAVWSTLGIPAVDTLLGGVEVYHATNFFLPPARRARRVLTIHDLAFLALPETCSPKIAGPFSRGIRRFATQADAILADSASTARDVVEILQVPPEKVTAAPLAADPAFQPVPKDEAARRVADGYGLTGPYLLFVGTLEPRKNLPTLLRALALLRSDMPHRLCLAGPEGWNSAEVFDTLRALRLEDRVFRPGFVAQADLPALYSAADAFVFPSLYEGFGLPVLEALSCGCPVVTANNSSLPEVTGDAALTCDARDATALAQSIRRILEDAALRESLVTRGLAHAKTFSWRRCAETTAGVYARVVRED